MKIPEGPRSLLITCPHVDVQCSCGRPILRWYRSWLFATALAPEAGPELVNGASLDYSSTQSTLGLLPSGVAFGCELDWANDSGTGCNTAATTLFRTSFSGYLQKAHGKYHKRIKGDHPIMQQWYKDNPKKNGKGVCWMHFNLKGGCPYGDKCHNSHEK